MPKPDSPIPDPWDGALKEPPPNDLSDYTWDDSETECYLAGRATLGQASSADGGTRSGSARLDDDAGRFQERLIDVGLVGELELQTLRARLFPDGQPADVPRLCTELIRQQRITPYQAAAIRQGKSRGLVIGDYHVLDRIGSGGMGLVLKARHRREGRVVALKLLPPSISRDRAAVARFRREAAAVARLRHPNIVAALDSGETHGLLYLVMELVDGKDLSRLVKQHGTLHVDQAIECTIQAARGLREAHRHGIIHRDIKPANLLLDHAGTVKILDLGLARINQGNDPLTSESSEQNLTVSGAIVGTVDYMAPEQAFDPRLADARSDIYALGCTLHYMLTGKAPYGGQSFMERLLGHRERPIPALRAARGDVPEELDALFRKLLAKSPEARPQTMAAVIDELKACRGPARGTPALRPAPVSRSSWVDEDAEPGAVYEVAETPSSTTRMQAMKAAPSTVFVRSRAPSDERQISPSRRRAVRRKRLIGGLLLLAALAACWYLGMRQGWLQGR